MQVTLHLDFILDPKLSMAEKGLLLMNAAIAEKVIDSSEVPCSDTIEKIELVVGSLKSKSFGCSINSSHQKTKKKLRFIKNIKPDFSETKQWNSTLLYENCREFMKQHGHKYPWSMTQEFIEYWTVPIGKYDEKWMQEADEGKFEIDRRLGTWYRKLSDYQRFENWKRSIDLVISKNNSIPEIYMPKSEDFNRLLLTYGSKWPNASYLSTGSQLEKPSIFSFSKEDYLKSGKSIATYLFDKFGPCPPADRYKEFEAYQDILNIKRI